MDEERETENKKVAFSASVDASSSSPPRGRRNSDHGKSRYIDLATGRTTALRRRSIAEVNPREPQTPGPRSGRQRVAASRFRGATAKEGDRPRRRRRRQGGEADRAEIDGDDAEADADYRQFRIRSAAFSEGYFATNSGATSVITESYRWAIKAPFWETIFCTFVAYLILILFFTLLVFWIGREQPQCISVPSEEKLEHGTRFTSSFQLSWTTLSTVGYGVMSPMTATEGERW
jgi:hypothetical protein